MSEQAFQRFFAKFTVLTTARLFGALAAFVASLLIARSFGASTLGEYSFFLSAGALLGAVLSLGFGSVATIFAAEYKALAESEKLAGFIMHARQQILVVTLLAGLALANLFVFMPHLFGQIELSTVFAIVGFGLTAALISLYSGTLIGLGRQFAGMVPESILRPTAFLLVLVAFVFVGVEPDGATIFFAALGSALLALIVMLILAQTAQTQSQTGIPAGEKKRWRKNAYPWIVTGLVWDYFIEVHILLAGLLVAPVEVAILHICFRFRVLAGFGMRTLYALLMPDIVGANASDRREDVMEKLRRTSIVAVGYGVVVMLGFWLLGDLLLAIFGEAFASAKPILLAVSSTILVRALFGPAPAILSMNGMQMQTAIIMAFALVLSIVGSLLAYADYGIWGIALSYAAANFLASMSLWIIARQRAGIDGSVLCLLPK